MNFNEEQTKKENCFPHGSRIMDLDVLRSSLKCCQHCKAGEKKQYFLPKENPKSTRIKLNSQFYGKYMYTQFWGYKIKRFSKDSYEIDYTFTSSMHYKTSHTQSAIKSRGLIHEFLGMQAG